MKKNLLLILILMVSIVFFVGCGSSDETQNNEPKDQVDSEQTPNGQASDDQVSFEGDLDDSLTGNGKYLENDVIKYEGMFVEGFPLGEGKFYEDGKLIFDGDVLSYEEDHKVMYGILYNENEEPFLEGEIIIEGNEIIFPQVGRLLNPDGSVLYEGLLDDEILKD